MNAIQEFMSYRPRVIGALINRGATEEMAKDIFQDIYLRYDSAVKRGLYVENGSLQGWMFLTGKNLLLDHWRKENRSEVYVVLQDGETETLPLIGSEDPSIEEEIIEEERKRILKEAIRTLEPPQREVMELRTYKNMAFREVVEETGRGLNTCLGNYRYGLRNLKKMLWINPPYQLKI